MPVGNDWDRIDSLELYVLEQGAPLELTEDTCAHLRRCARDVGLSSEETEDALRGVSTALTLLQEICRRIRDGSHRLGDARRLSSRLRDAGDLEGARKPLQDVLAVEAVSFYREQAEIGLWTLARLQVVADSGRVNPKVNDRVQLPVLVQRVRRGLPLELTEDLCAFVRRAAASAALGEAETQDALTSPERAGLLLQKVLTLRLEGSERIKGALLRMMELKEEGDLEGARQVLLDVLAVEVIPTCRRMAQENLEHLDALLAARR